MLFQLAVIFGMALALFWLFDKVGLPGILGLLLCGALLGPQLFGFISEESMDYAAELRIGALIVILIRAGLGISRETLNAVGLPAALLGVLPALFEGLTVAFGAYLLFGFSVPEAGMLGFILAAVSPAIVVPQMLELKEAGYGEKRHIPTLILASASLDDVVAITLFGLFAGLAAGQGSIGLQLAHMPISILLALCIGAAAGWLLVKMFVKLHLARMREALLFMVAAILLTELENRELIPVASLLGVMAMGFVVLELNRRIANDLSAVYAHIWIAAEVVLFVSLGAALDLQAAAAPETLLMALSLLALGLAARTLGVYLSLAIAGDLDPREKLFCAIAGLPKATVQAAMGTIPLAMGMPMGEVILSIAVISILITAPLGALAIRYAAPRLLAASAAPSP